MRTRKEIEDDVSAQRNVESLGTLQQPNAAILETLLDVRELLIQRSF